MSLGKSTDKGISVNGSLFITSVDSGPVPLKAIAAYPRQIEVNSGKSICHSLFIPLTLKHDK